jgi:hypothetical protein
VSVRIRLRAPIMEDIQKRIDSLKREKELLQFIRKRLGRGHDANVEHILAMGRPGSCPEDHMQRWQAIEAAQPFLKILSEKPKVYDLYYTTSDKLIGEDFLLWNYPELWVEFFTEQFRRTS